MSESIEVNLKFVDFYPGFDYKEFLLYKIFKKMFVGLKVIEDDDNETEPTLLICSVFGTQAYLDKYKGIKKLLFSGENSYPDFNNYDYAITCHDIYLNEAGVNRNCRIPYYAFENGFSDPEVLIKKAEESKKKVLSHGNPFGRDFCSCLISNVSSADPERENLFDDICVKYKMIDSRGVALNTAGKILPKTADKFDFFSKYKFNFAAENSLSEGYITEKLTNAFASYTIPIYFGESGNPKKTGFLYDEFNKDSFINATGMNRQELIKTIQEIDSDKDRYMEMLEHPFLKYVNWENRLSDYIFSIYTTSQQQLCHDYGRIGIENYFVNASRNRTA